MHQPFPQNILTALLTLDPTFFVLAFAAIVVDLVSGFLFKGLFAHNVRSSVMREGLVHKAWEVTLIICAALVDVALIVGMSLDVPQLVSAATCIFIFVMEIASVCENALEGYPQLASAPIIRYISQAKQGQAINEEAGDQGESKESKDA